MREALSQFPHTCGFLSRPGRPLASLWDRLRPSGGRLALGGAHPRHCPPRKAGTPGASLVDSFARNGKNCAHKKPHEKIQRLYSTPPLAHAATDPSSREHDTRAQPQRKPLPRAIHPSTPTRPHDTHEPEASLRHGLGPSAPRKSSATRKGMPGPGPLRPSLIQKNTKKTQALASLGPRDQRRHSSVSVWLSRAGHCLSLRGQQSANNGCGLLFLRRPHKPYIIDTAATLSRIRHL